MSLIIVAGVHLDRAWTNLGALFGGALRRWSRDVLARVVEEAHHRGIETLVIVGDLFDRATVLPDTVDYAAKVLGSFSGIVLLAPGRSDWIGGVGPYAYQDWAANTHIWSAADYQPCPQVPTIWGSGWTSPATAMPRIPDGSGPRVLVRAGVNPFDVGQATLGDGEVLVTSGTTHVGRMITVPDLVHDPRAEGGYAVVIDASNPSASARVDLPAQPGKLVEVDVTPLNSTDELAAALRDVSRIDGPVLFELSGVLAPAVLLPGFGGPELRPGAIVDIDRLQYAEAEADLTDRSARAEFLRALAASRATPLERHQTRAIGLAALDATS